MSTVTGAPGPGPTTRLGRRRTRNRATWVLCAVALALVVVPVVSIVAGVAVRALAHFRWSFLTTYPTGNAGGLLNSIQGTGVLVIGVLVLAGVIGVAGGVYLAEYARDGRGQFLRGASEVLAGVPSIVLGYVGYIAFVVQFHWGYSLYAGIIVVSVLVVPYIMKTTEVALRTVPTSYREGGEALGMRSGYLLRKLVLRPALPGIATGMIIAAAIAVGETAPLLLTAGYSTRSPTLFHFHTSPVGYLTYNVFNDYNQPFTLTHQRADTAALLLILLVLVLIVVARIFVMTTQRHSPDRRQGVAKATG